MNKVKHIFKNAALRRVALAATMLMTLSAQAETSDNRDLYTQGWPAQWITMPQEAPDAYGVYYFRKTINLTAVPETFPVHVTGDNRFKLFVNGDRVCMGPLRGDISHWNYETVDIAPYLKAGNNVVAAQVWNEGKERAIGNVSYRTGFLLQGGTQDAEILNTDESWKVTKDSAYSPKTVIIKDYYVAGPGESVDMHNYINGWNTLNINDSQWQPASRIVCGTPKNCVGFGFPMGWQLMPSPLPQLEMTAQRIPSVRYCKGMKMPTAFPAEKIAVTVPANSRVQFLLDQTHLTNAYLTLQFGKGEGSAITLGYQESLFNAYPSKGNRDEVEGKVFYGRKDSIISNGTDNQQFTTLAWRTFRYILVNIETKDQPLLINDIYSTFTGYPFELKASIQSDNKEIDKMLEIGWRTARLCAVDHYMDCPYYEQLQYLGDTRIQAMVSVYNSGDTRMMKNYLNMVDVSRQPEGITQSRYPSSDPQFITPFSLWYICSIYDYMMYVNDFRFVKEKLPCVRQILTYFQKYQQEDGSIKHLPWWNFTDWVQSNGWIMGAPNPSPTGNSALMDLQLLYTYQVAEKMERELGMKDYADQYANKATQLEATIQKKYWNAARGIYADKPELTEFSQHANTLAILTGMVQGDKARAIADKMLTDKSLAPASIYFKYYLHQALTQVGLGNDYMKWLDKWRENISNGLTTWGETSDVDATRSDCHAWGASPNIEFYRILLGIDTDAPQFAKVKIEPHLGDIQKISGEMPHPNGMIKVLYQLKKGNLNAVITLPRGVTGRFVWNGQSYPLQEGNNELSVK